MISGRGRQTTGMKKQRAGQYLIIVFCAFVLFFIPVSCSKPENVDVVQKAYELRMDGKADQALALLEKAVADNSDDADACYELARTRYHMMLGEPETLPKAVEEAHNDILRALELEPDNVIFAYFAGRTAFMKAYVAMQMDQAAAKEQFERVRDFYDSALVMKPDYYAALLYLVELCGRLPEDMGGDSAKGEFYTQKLESMDEIFGAKARFILSAKDADAIQYWSRIAEQHEGNVEVLEELGKAYLRQGNVEEGSRILRQAFSLNPEKNVLLLDLARYHIMNVMQGGDNAPAAMSLAEEELNAYLETEPSPPLKAFALGILSRLKSVSEDRAQAEKLFADAEAVDKYYSKAFGVPTQALFVPPGQLSTEHRYLFLPF